MTARRRAHDVKHWAVPVSVARRFHDEWRHDAACLDHPTLPASTWDDNAPGEGASAGPNRAVIRERRVATALAVCRNNCPVAAECWADVDLSFDDGVRGGVDLREVRAAMRQTEDQEQAS